MVVHSAFPARLLDAAGAALEAAGVRHIAHDPPAGGAVAAAVAAAEDPDCLAMIGPLRSDDTAEALEATAPAGLPMLSPITTWAGVTRSDEPGCDDAADHRGTVLRLVARDTEVAARIAADVRARNHRALVIAGRHDYGVQLDGQLRIAGLPRADGPGEADLLVLCGLVGEPEVDEARAIDALPIVAFDGPQGGDVGLARPVHLALPFAPAAGDEPFDHLAHGAAEAERAARMIVDALRAGATDRASMLVALRAAGPFDEHGDPFAPSVWLWRAGEDWSLRPERPLQG
jgi:hypothetical protein